MRSNKLDELPQLFNINMSLLEPRPDIAGYYNTLKGENRLILGLRPGLTSDEEIKFRHEEKILNR